MEDRFDSVRLIRHFARRQELLRCRISKIEEEADRLAMDLARFAGNLSGRRHAVAHDAGGPVSPRRAAGEALRRTAEAGVTAVALTRRSDGYADVQVDGGAAFTLPPALADLLCILAAPRARGGDDGLTAWKTLDEIARLLEKKSGRPFTTHAVTQQIHRLRRELFERGGINPWLVQTNRRAGARFAVRAALPPCAPAEEAG